MPIGRCALRSSRPSKLAAPPSPQLGQHPIGLRPSVADELPQVPRSRSLSKSMSCTTSPSLSRLAIASIWPRGLTEKLCPQNSPMVHGASMPTRMIAPIVTRFATAAAGWRFAVAGRFDGRLSLAILWPGCPSRSSWLPRLSKTSEESKRISGRRCGAHSKTHLRHEPEKTSRSRIKPLQGLRRPQYRLRISEVRVFYDVSGATVEVLAIVAKSEAESWLAQFGTRE